MLKLLKTYLTILYVKAFIIKKLIARLLISSQNFSSNSRRNLQIIEIYINKTYLKILVIF